jgi:hypothetical protein
MSGEEDTSKIFQILPNHNSVPGFLPSQRSIPAKSDVPQCDKATPSCSQCIRAHRICPGYRNQLDLMFRIQNDVVIEKSKSRDPSKPMTHSKRAPAASKSSEILLVRNLKGISIEDEVFRHSREYVDRQGAFVTTLLPTFSMSPDLEQRARGFFATHSVELNPDFDLVHKLCTQTSADAHLLASINAVGLASFSQYVHSPELMVKARQDYILALGLTNAALRSPKEVKKDSTLFSVMILSIFETIAGTTVDSLVA